LHSVAPGGRNRKLILGGTGTDSQARPIRIRRNRHHAGKTDQDQAEPASCRRDLD
jgi:hypothetical protein